MRVEKTDDIVLGVRDDWGREVPFSLSVVDRRHHALAVGKSGVGKSTLLFNMAMQDIYAGRGVGLVDPHGDLCDDILAHIPKNRIEDVVYFDPTDSDYPVALNLLAHVGPDRRDEMIDGIIAAFKGTWGDFFGPRMERLFRFALASLYYCQNASLLGVERMLTDATYRAWVVKQVKDPKVRGFWARQFDVLDRETQAEHASPILNKIDAFLLPQGIRNVVGQVRNTVDARFVMDRGRIFIARLSKGKLGAERAALLGALWVTLFQVAAMSRADTPQSARRDFFLYVDEWQSCLTGAFASVLSECRKYRLCLTLANQYFEQIDPKVLAAVFGNVSSIVAFRVGHEDAAVLERAFGGHYAASQFTSLSNGEVVAKLLRGGCELDPFRGRTLPPVGVRRGHGQKIIARSRQKYAQRRERGGAEDREVVRRAVPVMVLKSTAVPVGCGAQHEQRPEEAREFQERSPGL